MSFEQEENIPKLINEVPPQKGFQDKIGEYVLRIEEGEKIESFGDIPQSWKQEINRRLKEKEEIQKKIDKRHKQDQEEINKIRKEILDTSKPEGLEEKNNKLKEYLLNKIQDRFTKEVSRNLAISNIQKANNLELYKIALDQFYNDNRKANYDRNNEKFDYDVEQVTSEVNDLIKRVQNENGWHYRIPQTATTANKSKERFSLNVWANKELVRRLDELTYKYGIYYKTPTQADDWNERTDPVTIYITNPDLTPDQIEQLKQEVIQVTKDFIRDNNGFGIYGENISEGVEFGPESTPEEIKRLKTQAETISLEAKEALDQYLQRNGKEKSSVGQNIAAQRLINFLS
ncbi:hypothetical protein H6790_00980 [Candidatus Nomurabacteria bacterium]|nr:hypothetical protein [Candidatus Nomurabacteria bacterium]MCB9820501.1 hypothetical protein [Candidatus Nomurabacteria bacterium]